MSLMTLVPELIDLILSPDISYAAIRLWMSGDKRLQHRISQSLTVISLKQTQLFSLNRLPTLLVHLKALRDLRIDRVRHRLLYPLQSIIHALPPSMRRLELRFEDSYKLVEFTSSSTADLSPDNALGIATGISKSNWSLKVAFPQLDTLVTRSKKDWTSDDFLALPETLTSLGMGFPDDCKDLIAFASMIPRQLLHLELNWSDSLSAEFLRHLPPNLTSFQGGESTYSLSGREDPQLLSSLPRSLTNFPVSLRDFPSAAILGLPQNITKVDYQSTVWDQDLRLALPSLKEFCTTAPKASTIKNLPPSIEKLCIRALNDDSLHNFAWPPCLTVLELFAPKQSLRLHTLPSSLTTLKLHEELYFPYVSAILPKLNNLTSLQCSVATTTMEFPPHLTELYLRSLAGHWLTLNPPMANKQCCLNGKEAITGFPLERLPHTLTSLRIVGTLYASQLKHLPAKLRVLIVNDIFLDAKFDSLNPAEISRISSNFKLGLEAGIQEQFDSTTAVPSIATLLPRTLTDLRISEAESALEIIEWEKVPPAITYLTLESKKGLSPRALKKIPLKHMRHLRIRMESLEDDDIKALPRTIWCGHFSVQDPSQLTPAAVLYLPNEFILYLSPNPNANRMHAAFQAFEAAKLKYCREDDLSIFVKLMSRDEDAMNYLELEEAR